MNVAISVAIRGEDELVDVDDYFFSKKYFMYQKEHFKHSLYLVAYKSQKPIGVFHCFSSDGRLWSSPGKGTFGGLFLIDPSQLAEMYEIYKLIIKVVMEAGGESLEITLPPENHSSSVNARHSWVLRSLGAEVILSDLNHFITVDSYMLDSKLNYGNRKRLRKCEKEGFIFQKLTAENLFAVYELLEKNRASKQNKLSLSRVQLKDLIEWFPDRITLFGLLHPSSDEMLSAAVCIKLNSATLYVFYWGNDPDYSNYSPVVPLACGIYSYCETNGIEILDLGVSTLNMEGNFGLVQFKDNLGAAVSRKERVRLRLSS